MKSFYEYTYQIPADQLITGVDNLTMDISYAVVNGNVLPFEVKMTLAVMRRIKDCFELERLIQEETRRQALKQAA